MKPLLFVLTGGLLLIGCGKSNQAPEPASKPPPKGLPSMTQAPGAGSPGAASTIASTPTAPGGVMPPPAPIDFATVQRTAVGHGPLPSDLDILNQALEIYRTGAPRPGSDSLVGGRDIKDLNELVKAGLVKALPTPPAGKQFALDSKTGTAVLVDKK